MIINKIGKKWILIYRFYHHINFFVADNISYISDLVTISRVCIVLKIARTIKTCTLIWPRLWNFTRSQSKFKTFLVTNEYPERICLYLVREFDDEPSKIGHFQISKSIFGAKCDLIFLKQKFLFEYQIRRTTFIKSMYFLSNLKNFIQ